MPSPDEIEAQVAQYAALGTPEASVTAVTVDDGGDVATTSRLAFADDERSRGRRRGARCSSSSKDGRS